MRVVGRLRNAAVLRRELRVDNSRIQQPLSGRGLVLHSAEGHCQSRVWSSGDKVRLRMVLTPEDVELLRQLKAAGECGCNIRRFNTRVALQRLARGGYVVARAGVELVNYRITKRGEDAIAEHD
jgi:hypothetical protein